jgi:hypothetical protein
MALLLLSSFRCSAAIRLRAPIVSSFNGFVVSILFVCLHVP